MITIFNRREIFMTFSLQAISDMRVKLNSYNINYYIKTINRNSPSVFSDTRERTGTFCEKIECAYEYIIYVHKNDYDKASAVVNHQM